MAGLFLTTQALDFINEGQKILERLEVLEKQVKELKAVIILPLYLYDHSGIAIKVGSFICKAVHAEWDSGKIGFIYATKEDIKKKLLRNPHADRAN